MMTSRVARVGRFSVFAPVFLAAFLVSVSAHAIPAESWDQGWGLRRSVRANNPSRLEGDFQFRFKRLFDRHFDRLPLEKMVTPQHMPYADTYWPANRGGIAYRWNSKDPLFAWQDPHIKADPAIFKYHSPSKVEALRMSRGELEQLSPTEKFDLVSGHYDYPLTKKVLSKTNPFRAYWEGICHGWAPAATNHSEPAPNDVVNPDGVVVPFAAADVKAVLDYYYGTENMSASQLGLECHTDLEKNPKDTSPECLDVNAGAFHIVLANFVGLADQSVVAEVSRGVEVWNNPIYAYSSKVVSVSAATKSSAKKTVKRVAVETVVRYPSDDERLPPQALPTVGAEQVLVPETEGPLELARFANVYRYSESKYKYWLELNAAGEIIGGEWISFDRPDYLWMKGKMLFRGEFEALNKVYKPVSFR
jgi:hypothetical protein